MINPILRVWLAVESRALDVDSRISRIEVDVADGGGFSGLRVGNVNTLEERGYD